MSTHAHRVKKAVAKKEETIAKLKQQFEERLSQLDSEKRDAVNMTNHLEGLLEQQRKKILSKK